jgi:hypothetical protein
VTNSNFDLIKSDRLSQEQITKALFRTQALFVDSLFRNAKHLKKLADFPVPDIENLGPANISMVMDQLKKFNPGL